MKWIRWIMYFSDNIFQNDEEDKNGEKEIEVWQLLWPSSLLIRGIIIDASPTQNKIKKKSILCKSKQQQQQKKNTKIFLFFI